MAIPLSPWPRPSLRFLPVWRRNLRVWRKLMVPSIMGNFGEPLLYLLVFGYGFGRLVGDIGELPYMVFLASGIVCSSVMFAASFEGLYSAFYRMHEQRTWSAMLNAPLNVDDIVTGEIAWAGTKGAFSGLAILVVTAVLGLTGGWLALWVLLLIPLIGLCFGAMAVLVTALSPTYDFFLYYFTLMLTPMLLISGVFFPLVELPAAVQVAAYLLPLAHAVELVRPLMLGELPAAVWLHIPVVAGYGLIAASIAILVLRRRLAA